MKKEREEEGREKEGGRRTSTICFRLYVESEEQNKLTKKIKTRGVNTSTKSRRTTNTLKCAEGRPGVNAVAEKPGQRERNNGDVRRVSAGQPRPLPPGVTPPRLGDGPRSTSAQFPQATARN